eukprot:TRINITY_DN8561_c0_g1_i2.p1 TRINITY_DN8561_c0_g1~~TRINITY_DN8561_c0_g1_i2.p1  ORF type:complete len:248 (-),score=23.72 TRINITY_DN8561_c0_g1_i2:18-671(-)
MGKKKGFEQNATTLKLDLKGNITKSSPPPQKQEPKYVFGDLSKDDDSKDVGSEEKLIDSKLNGMNLTRKKIPKDGACLFRAISDRVLLSQSYHYYVRQKCVDHMLAHQEDYEPFTCVSGLPYDHYCFEMRKVNTWGGQVEIQALSMIYKVNFAIHSNQSSEPTLVDNNFSKTIDLCYYGNHYDSVYPNNYIEREATCQGFIYDIICLLYTSPSPRDA